MNREKQQKYYAGLGRRKSATARVRLIKPGKEIIINGKKLDDYFPLLEMRKIIRAPFKLIDKSFNTKVQVKGGGVRGQAESIRLGIARALLKINSEYKEVLKKVGFLTRDPRVKERKKPGLRKARRAPQWSKR